MFSRFPPAASTDDPPDVCDESSPRSECECLLIALSSPQLAPSPLASPDPAFACWRYPLSRRLDRRDARFIASRCLASSSSSAPLAVASSVDTETLCSMRSLESSSRAFFSSSSSSRWYGTLTRRFMIVSWCNRSLAQTFVWYVGLALWIRPRIAAFSESIRCRCRFRPMLFKLLLIWCGDVAIDGVVKITAIFWIRSVLSFLISILRFSRSCFDLSLCLRWNIFIVDGGRQSSPFVSLPGLRHLIFARAPLWLE